MCVLSYMPTEQGYILTHNRDETVYRPKAIAAAWYEHSCGNLFYAKDPLSRGTWMATNGSISMALLNGAFEKHSPKPPYAKSRGGLIIEFFEKSYYKTIPGRSYFSDFENFTLIIVQEAGPIVQLVWDGNALYQSELSTKDRHIWSSCTLYSPEITQQRHALYFEAFSEKKDYSAGQLLDFHQQADIGDVAHNFIMQRANGIRTQCLLQFCKDAQGIHTQYIDLLEATT